jgi:hypothetical protein
MYDRAAYLRILRELRDHYGPILRGARHRRYRRALASYRRSIGIATGLFREWREREAK